MVLDSFGIGVTGNVERFSDIRANTLGHIAEACVKGEADNGRKSPLNLPNLTRLGLAEAHGDSISFIPAGMDDSAEIIGAYAWTHEISSGKGTPSGHQETAGVPVLLEWEHSSGYKNSFPQELLDKLVERASLSGYPDNCHSSGTVILDQLSEGHMKTGKPIFYISTDFVFQIVCHEETSGLDKPYELCEIAREELINGGYSAGRAIARPFIGDKAGNFQRTDNRHDLAVEPPAPTVLQELVDGEHGQVVSVGKIVDIYVNCGITEKVKATGLDALSDAAVKEMREAGDNTVIFTSSVDFDSSWGRRRDIVGYAAGLELFDRCLPELMSLLRDSDILILIADRGCDPTQTGTDHTRKCVPILVYGPKVKPGLLGHRETFADIDQTLAKYFGISDTRYGRAML